MCLLVFFDSMYLYNVTQTTALVVKQESQVYEGLDKHLSKLYNVLAAVISASLFSV